MKSASTRARRVCRLPRAGGKNFDNVICSQLIRFVLCSIFAATRFRLRPARARSIALVPPAPVVTVPALNSHRTIDFGSAGATAGSNQDVARYVIMSPKRPPPGASLQAEAIEHSSVWIYSATCRHRLRAPNSFAATDQREPPEPPECLSRSR